VFRSPAKLASLWSQRDRHLKEPKPIEVATRCGEATLSKLNTPGLNARTCREKSSVLEQRVRAAEAVRPVLRLSYSGAGCTFLRRGSLSAGKPAETTVTW
jgi:hypothetical protein